MALTGINKNKTDSKIQNSSSENLHFHHPVGSLLRVRCRSSWTAADLFANALILASTQLTRVCEWMILHCWDICNVFPPHRPCGTAKNKAHTIGFCSQAERVWSKKAQASFLSFPHMTVFFELEEPQHLWALQCSAKFSWKSPAHLRHKCPYIYKKQYHFTGFFSNIKDGWISHNFIYFKLIPTT